MNTKDLSIAERIICIQNELRVNKDGRNTFSNYDYFKPDEILQALNPLLQKYNVFVKFDLEEKSENTYSAKTTIRNAEGTVAEVYLFDINKASVKGANEAQNSGATMTYAKRYSLMNIFNIAENSSDFDSDDFAKKNTQNKKQTKEEIVKFKVD
jgi:hypothetical protein